MQNNRAVAIWLLAMCALIALMIVVGGATRLTDSGLSIVEWRPVTGAVPPLSEAGWLAEFEKYKTIPEYHQVNLGMSLAEFKHIYWWEWGHRFLGRVIAFAFLLPLIFFAATRRVNRTLGMKLFGLFALGGLQGALGWWMVSSGLAERVDVSQYRLAAHLGLALLLFAAMLWLGLDLSIARPRAAPHRLAPYALALLAGIYAQMILGAFVAGLRAGRVYNTWPLMEGKFFPDAYFDGAPAIAALFERTAAVQFNHRIGAYVLFAATLVFVIAAKKTALAPRARMVFTIVVMQALLGIWTVIAGTPLVLGLAHQAMAIILLSAAVVLVHGSMTSIEMTLSSADSPPGMRGSTTAATGIESAPITPFQGTSLTGAPSPSVTMASAPSR
ncbi:MAG: COX15/CtaA family protein [Parvularculaceae bacterium]|nr:COX15/CtaA family protein [Parvularculaceae bacterium]